jgi:hypothetical protein
MGSKVPQAFSGAFDYAIPPIPYVTLTIWGKISQGFFQNIRVKAIE